MCQVIRSSEDIQNTLFDFKGKPYPKAPGIRSGAVGVLLSWDMCYPNVDLDLDVGSGLGFLGYMDVKDDENASFEHFVIESESDIVPSNTPHAIYAHDKTDHSKLDPSRIATYDPIDIAVAAYAPGTVKVFKTQIRDLAQLDLGHILDILVKKKHVTYPTRIIGGGGSTGGGGANPCEGHFDCGCIPCEYKITNFLKNAMLGPISGGAVKIQNISNNSTVYAGTTTKGDDIVTTGVIEIPGEILDTFDDNAMYLIDVEGGEDIDSNDDLYIDATPIPNLGTLHAIVTGKQLKYLSFKVNILTEIAYQVSKDKLGDSPAQLIVHLDDIAKRIFRQKVLLVDETTTLNYLDILTWVPALDKRNLKKDYDTFVEPIVQKVYANKDRLQESYDFVYKRADAKAPEIGTLNISIGEGLPKGAVVGTLEIRSHGDSSIKEMSLTGVGADNFTINKEGVVFVAMDANISEQSFYNLNATDTNDNIHTSTPVFVLIKVVKNTGISVSGGSVPYVVDIAKRAIDENSPEGVIVGKITFDDTNNSIISIQIEGGSTQFDIAQDGTITVAANADIDYEKTQSIALKVSATNNIGNTSLPMLVNITINDVIDTPVYKIFFVTHIDENLSSGSVIGQLEQVRAGASEISSIDILNSNVPFSIDTNGTIYLDGYVDYETLNEYNLVAIARSATGDSNRIYLNIYIDDIVEVGMPQLYDFNTTIDENIPSGTVIGTLNFLQGQSPIESMTLSGVGSSNFNIDTNGVLSLATNANIDYESLNVYDLDAIARNANGSSNTAHVNILVNNVLDVPYELLSFTASLEENATANTLVGKLSIAKHGEGNITGYTLTGTGSENFTVDENGTIRVSGSANLDYETTPLYNLEATVLSSAGESSPTQVRIYLLNVPENPPVLQPFSASIEEAIPKDTLLGSIAFVNSGDSAIDSYEINGSSKIYIDNNGTVFSAIDMNWSIDNVIHFEVRAHNGAGWSEWKTGEFTVLRKNYTGDASDNTLMGSQRDEVFSGKLGNDMIQGGGGDDTYIYTLGDGNDTIVDTVGEDTLVLHQIDRATVHFEIDANDMVLVFENNQTIRISNWVDNSRKIEHIIFDNDNEITLDDFNHPIATPDVGIADLSKLGNINAAKVVQGFIEPIGNGRDKVDHWIFNYSGGELIIDTLSELNDNGHSYIDIDGDGIQLGVDIYIYLYKKDGNGQWQIVASDDDSSETYGDGSSHKYDSYLKRSLEEGEYLLAVGNFSLSSANALAGSNGAGNYPGGGAYQITFNHEIDFIEIPEGSNGDVYGTDHFNYYVLKNDIDPYNINGLLLGSVRNSVSV